MMFAADANTEYTVHSACKTYAENCYYDGASTKGNVICDWNTVSHPGSYAESGSVFVNCNRTVRGEGTANNPSYSTDCTWRPNTNYSYKALSAEEAKAYCETYSGSQTSAAKMNYAVQTAAGLKSAGYVEAPTTEMNPPEPINGILIQNLTVHDTTRNAWSIDASIAVGDLVFGDRDVTYAALPDVILGAEAIVTACDAKNSTENLATFTAGADMTVYVALDSRVDPAPAWLADYTQTTLTATNNKDVSFVLYALEAAAGDTIVLGANGKTSGCVNYTVFATEASAKAVLGDVNADSTFSIADVVMLQKWLIGAGDITHWQAGDLNYDNRLDAADLTLIKRLLLP